MDVDSNIEVEELVREFRSSQKTKVTHVFRYNQMCHSFPNRFSTVRIRHVPCTTLPRADAPGP